MRITIFVFTVLVLTFAIFKHQQKTPIYDMVSAAYQVTLVGAFVPLAFGVYWSRATTQGALSSILLGVGTWLGLSLSPNLGEIIPAQLGGLLASILGMIFGSLLPQSISSRQTTEEEMYSVHPAHLGHDGPINSTSP